MSGLISWFARNRVAANLLMLAIVAAGLIMAPSIGQEIFPEVKMGMIAIHVVQPGASPAEIEETILFKLEEAIQRRLDRKALRLVVDLENISYICSAGINVLGHTVAQFERMEGQLCYVLPSQDAQRKFFATIGIDRLCPWAESLDEALNRVAPEDKSPTT